MAFLTPLRLLPSDGQLGDYRNMEEWPTIRPEHRLSVPYPAPRLNQGNPRTGSQLARVFTTHSFDSRRGQVASWIRRTTCWAAPSGRLKWPRDKDGARPDQDGEAAAVGRSGVASRPVPLRI